MITTFILTAMVEVAGLGPSPISCTFPATAAQEAPIRIEMTARPSLKDLPGLYRVRMAVDGRTLSAAAQPIVTTDAPDVLVRASQDEKVFYALGFDAEGLAALNVVWEAEGEVPQRRVTRTGYCRNYEAYLPAWSRP